MSTYAKYFKSVDAALSSDDLVSPNATLVTEDSKSKYLMIDCGKDKPVEIVGSAIENLIIKEKMPNNEIWYKTINNNEQSYDLQAVINLLKQSFGEYTGPALLSNELKGEWYVMKFDSKLTSLGIVTNGEGTEILNFNAPLFGSNFLSGDKKSIVTEVKLPKSITALNFYSFVEDNLLKVDIPINVSALGAGAIVCESITSITIPNNVKTIGTNAVVCPSLEYINISANVEYIGESTFSECSSLTSITIDPNNTHYSSHEGVLFDYNKSTLIHYPGGNLRESYTMPNNVSIIEKYAFENAKNLKSIIMSSSLTTIGNYAFSSASSNINSITCHAVVPPTCGRSCFDYVSIEIPVYAPAESISAYKNADTWKRFKNYYSI